MANPPLEGQPRDNDRQDGLVVVLFCPFSPLPEWKEGEGGGSLLTTACKCNFSMHRSTREACLHPMCCD